MTNNKETITLTEAAAEQVLFLAEEDSEEGQFLRFGVEEGGCSGHEYAMGFDFPQEDDILLESRGIKIIIDPNSFEYLKGIEVDFNDGLEGKGFSFNNPNAKRHCGCGKSFN
ncbi:MAG: iron-sulfur cluster assembly accessory protein [Verrucomicrobia bacterium]|nr:MAG: iron-sulfur cluster assembly accessory protein [Verrucomicrobiota bacterium]